jgi:hypothetical protein
VPESTRDPATEIIARMTPAQKLEASMRLYWSARKLKAAGIRAEHPEWSEAEVAAAVRAAFLFHNE